MAFSDTMLKLFAPAGINAGVTALSNRGRPKRQRDNPLASALQGLGGGLQGVLQEYEEGRKLSSRAKEITSQLDLDPKKDEDVKWVRERLKENKSVDQMREDLSRAEGIRETAIDREAIDTALSGIPAGPVSRPSTTSGFWESLEKGRPDLLMDPSADDLLKLDPERVIKERRTLDVKGLGPDEQRRRFNETLPGQFLQNVQGVREHMKSTGTAMTPENERRMFGAMYNQMQGKTPAIPFSEIMQASMGTRTPVLETPEEVAKRKQIEDARSFWSKYVGPEDAEFVARVSVGDYPGVKMSDLQGLEILPQYVSGTERYEADPLKYIRENALAEIEAKYDPNLLENKERYRPQAEQNVMAKYGSMEQYHLDKESKGSKQLKIEIEDDYRDMVDDEVERLMASEKAQEKAKLKQSYPKGQQIDDSAIAGIRAQTASVQDGNEEMMRRIAALEEKLGIVSGNR